MHHFYVSKSPWFIMDFLQCVYYILYKVMCFYRDLHLSTRPCIRKEHHWWRDLLYLCVAQSIKGDIMLRRFHTVFFGTLRLFFMEKCLNPIEKFKVAILHLNRDWNHWHGPMMLTPSVWSLNISVKIEPPHSMHCGGCFHQANFLISWHDTWYLDNL